MHFIVDRKTWYRGQGSSYSKLLRPDGHRCCVGFRCQAAGIPDDAVLHIPIVRNIGTTDDAGFLKMKEGVFIDDGKEHRALLPAGYTTPSPFGVMGAIENIYLVNDALAMVRGQIHTLEADLQQLRKLEANELKETRIICTGDTFDSTNGCRSLLPIKELIYIQTHWYTEPHGCAGGDYWNLGEGQFECPQCKVRNRLYERPEIEALKEFFKRTDKRHDQ